MLAAEQAASRNPAMASVPVWDRLVVGLEREPFGQEPQPADSEMPRAVRGEPALVEPARQALPKALAQPDLQTGILDWVTGRTHRVGEIQMMNRDHLHAMPVVWGASGLLHP